MIMHLIQFVKYYLIIIIVICQYLILIFKNPMILQKHDYFILITNHKTRIRDIKIY